MFAAHGATRRDQITLGHLIFYHDFDVRKGAPELAVEGPRVSKGYTEFKGAGL